MALTDPALAAAVDRLRRHVVDAGLTDAGAYGDPGLADAFGDSAATGALRDSAAAGACRDTAAEPAGTGEPVVVVTDRNLPESTLTALTARAARGSPVVLLGPTVPAAPRQWAAACGLTVAAGGEPRVTAVHDVRLRPGPDAGALADRLVDHAHSSGAHLGAHTHVSDQVLVAAAGDGTEVLVTARLGLDTVPVAVRRGQLLAWTLGATPAALDTPALRRLVLLSIRELLALPAALPAGRVRIGLLGYGAIGHEHNRAVAAVAGLALTSVCDRSDERLAAARALAPDARTTNDPDALLDEPSVDLIVVSTPPDSHAHWALRALAAGKHVVVEKPFAISTADADTVLAAAERADRLAVVYQNRRWDPDHLALRRAVRAGLLGELFSIETFVGGYGHPCNLWHSDSGVSGGVFYDWGAHVLDQILDLVPAPVEHVTAASHKRVWHDVTNADHARVTVRFVGGAEAEFVYSDIAAALKPRWYVLGTAGAVVGQWRREKVVSRNDIGALAEDPLAPADSPPVLDLHTADGSVTRLAQPPAPPYPFHRELADHLLAGVPMSVTGRTSRRVLSVMEAAATSAATGSVPVVPR